MQTAFTSHGYDYGIDKHGVVTQLNPKPFVYDPEYSAIYDNPEYTRQSELLQAMRLAFVNAAHGRPVMTLQDIGYGNGAFMKFAVKNVIDVTGHDITGLQIDGFKCLPYLNRSDVKTMWDVLEHYHELKFLSFLECETLCISLPYCHYHSRGQEWFDTKYKHRKPNEHIRHFTPDSLISTLRSHGWECIAISHHEDIVRKSTHGLENIISAAFKKK